MFQKSLRVTKRRNQCIALSPSQCSKMLLTHHQQSLSSPLSSRPFSTTTKLQTTSQHSVDNTSYQSEVHKRTYTPQGGKLPYLSASKVHTAAAPARDEEDPTAQPTVTDTIAEQRCLYLTVPPRYRVSHLTNRLTKIHERMVLLGGIDFLCVFMKSPTVSSRKALVQFANARIRRLFWEYYFMGRVEVEDHLLRELEELQAMHQETNAAYSSEMHQTDVEYDKAQKEFQQAELSSKVFHTHSEDLEYFADLYNQYGWKPLWQQKSHMTSGEVRAWEGTPISVTTGSVFPLWNSSLTKKSIHDSSVDTSADYHSSDLDSSTGNDSSAFRVLIEQLPVGTQEWMIDEWYRDNVARNYEAFDGKAPLLQRRVIHLNDGGYTTRRCSLELYSEEGNVDADLKQVMEVLSGAPFRGERLQVHLQ